MVYTTILSSTYDSKFKIINEYTLFTKKVGPGTLCIWKIHDIQRINYILSSEYKIHKKVRMDAKKRKNKIIGSKLQKLKEKENGR